MGSNWPTPYIRGAPDIERLRTQGRRRRGKRAPFPSHLHAANALMNPVVFADPAKTEVLTAIVKRAACWNEDLVKGHLAEELRRWGLDASTTAKDAKDPVSGEVRLRAACASARARDCGRVLCADAWVLRRNSFLPSTCQPCSRAMGNL